MEKPRMMSATEDSVSTMCSNPAQVTLKYKNMNNVATLSHVEIHCVLIKSKAVVKCGPGSSVGIATGYRLNGPGIESRWEA
jgi:hypothetical protein